MEKYRSTADPSTGIHPFIPPTFHPFRPLLRPILTLLRLPFFIILFPPFLLLNSFLFLLPSLLSYPLRRILDKLFIPYILLSLSVIPTYPTIEQPRVRGAVRGKHPSRSDILLANSTSPIDILLLSFAYSPTFAVPSDTPSHVHPLTLSQALLQTCTTPSIPKSPPQTLKQLLRRNGPISILAEGCSTNGKGVLRFRFTPNPQSIPDNSVLYAAGISYTPRGAGCRTIQSMSSALLHAMGEWRISARIRLTAVPQDGAEHQACVATLAGVPPLKIDLESGRRFAQHWKDTASCKS
ncbi:putative lysophosphatidic acid:oleoyl-CoA acyltransferase [Gracilariopsis chorda]|uniref:Putative lysophosphatidic acid:oleoyl-CoA acyltransferase n=1 Tax=Gracilariopsis chorda TaxID=448386 RepID=A0A2V3IKD1_9FLOR|nr:putative lysophosphatidic acid:oleoyl-CoA acyltransferase [Gracilariopsis chorda]|eukprot:PXF42556.1 putative lysophosphatidic acid:oleoyl-CoA acyltransferase [Gracilariopsis chorda]